MEDNNMIHTLINNILKSAFREIKSLNQLGRSPRFFDMEKGIPIKDGLVSAYSGFRASAFNY